MSMLNIRREKDQQRMPRASTVPQSGTPTRAPQHEDFADEAKRAAQRYLDQVQQIDALVAEVEQWRNRAILAEGEISRLQDREAALQATIDRKADEFANERDATRQAIAVLAASYTNASKIILDGFQTIERLDGLKARINMPAIEAAITPQVDPHDHIGEPMPSVVTKGPAHHDDGDVDRP
jgi:hypothetical protein